MGIDLAFERVSSEELREGHLTHNRIGAIGVFLCGYGVHVIPEFEDSPSGSVAEIVNPWFLGSGRDYTPEWSLMPIPFAFPLSFPRASDVFWFTGDRRLCSGLFESSVIAQAGGKAEENAKKEQRLAEVLRHISGMDGKVPSQVQNPAGDNKPETI